MQSSHFRTTNANSSVLKAFMSTLVLGKFSETVLKNLPANTKLQLALSCINETRGAEYSMLRPKQLNWLTWACTIDLVLNGIEQIVLLLTLAT